MFKNSHIFAFNDEIDLGWCPGNTPTFRITGMSLVSIVNVVQMIKVFAMQIQTWSPDHIYKHTAAYLNRLIRLICNEKPFALTAE